MNFHTETTEAASLRHVLSELSYLIAFSSQSHGLELPTIILVKLYLTF